MGVDLRTGIYSQLLNSLSPAAFVWLLAGGVIYTVGGVIYALKLPIFNSKHKYFGSHEIFHLFVMAGSACHFVGDVCFCTLMKSIMKAADGTFFHLISFIFYLFREFVIHSGSSLRSRSPYPHSFSHKFPFPLISRFLFSPCQLF